MEKKKKEKNSNHNYCLRRSKKLLDEFIVYANERKIRITRIHKIKGSISRFYYFFTRQKKD